MWFLTVDIEQLFSQCVPDSSKLSRTLALSRTLLNSRLLNFARSVELAGFYNSRNLAIIVDSNENCAK